MCCHWHFREKYHFWLFTSCLLSQGCFQGVFALCLSSFNTPGEVYVVEKGGTSPLSGHYILVFHSWSYIPVSLLYVKALCSPTRHLLVPPELLLQTQTQEKEIWRYASILCWHMNGQNSNPSITQCLMAGYYKHIHLGPSSTYLFSKHQCHLLCFAKSEP